jgi:hypothetical protein
MKKVEVLEISSKSMFKTMLYLTCIPFGLMAAIGLIISIFGAAFGHWSALFIGVPYMILPVILILVYALLSMVIALVYSKLARKFGGLELVVAEQANAQESAWHV